MYEGTLKSFVLITLGDLLRTEEEEGEINMVSKAASQHTKNLQRLEV